MIRSHHNIPANRWQLAIKRPQRRSQGILLVECVVYLGAWFVVAAVAFAAFYKSMDFYRQLNGNADDIASALQAGERWRADIRSATGPVRSEKTDLFEILHVPQKQRDVLYSFSDGAMFRKPGTNAPWAPVLEGLKASRINKEQRQHVSCWTWEFELAPRQKKTRVRPLFTFVAVPPMEMELRQ